jgi:putative membrane protein
MTPGHDPSASAESPRNGPGHDPSASAESPRIEPGHDPSASAESPRIERLPPPVPAVAGMSERAMGAWVWGLTLVVVALVGFLVSAGQVLAVEGLDVSRLPGFHALLNGTCALLLVAGVAFVRQGRIGLHRAAMVGAFALSTIFLVSYVVYHAQTPSTPFGGEGWIRPVYFTVLISHIVLAPVILPLALYTVLRAFRAEYARHRRIARWTFPLWLYVAVTGVTVYWLMAPYY